MIPDLLVIGHAAKDLYPGGYRLGGTVTYAAVTARRLGLFPAVVTSASEDVDFASVLADVPIHVKPAPDTTTFINEYDGAMRVQRLTATAAPITEADVPASWHDAPLVLLGPLIGELDGRILDCFPRSLVVASIQGWLRQAGSDGVVSPRGWSGEGILPNLSAAVVSDQDITDEAQIEVWNERTPVLIVTKGLRGAQIYLEGQREGVAAFPTESVDPTGAGDVFATAYLVRLQETGDPIRAATFAACVASFCVEAHGTEGIPTRYQVEERLAASRRRG